MGPRRLQDRIAEVRHELALRTACGGPDHLEREEELLDELADLEQEPCRESSPADKKLIREVNRWS